MTREIGDLRPYLVKILQASGDEVNGTGFFCHPDGYILTCYHVIEKRIQQGLKYVNILYKTKAAQPAEICIKQCDVAADFAVLKLPNLPQGAKWLPLDTHDRKSRQKKDSIRSFGYPEGSFSSSGIAITGSLGGLTPTLDEYGVEIYPFEGLRMAEVNSGYSGAPIFDERIQKVIGLMYAKRDANQAFYISLKKLFYKSPLLIQFHDIYYQIRNKLAENAADRLSDKLQGSTYIPLRLAEGKLKSQVEKEESSTSIKKRLTEEQGRLWENFDLTKLYSRKEKFILSCDVGVGKTTFLNWLVTKIVRDTDQLPLFAPCVELEQNKLNSWKKFVDSVKDDLASDYIREDVDDCLNDFFDQQKVVFIFDALDQIKEGHYKNLIDTTVKKLVGKSTTIISSRPTAVSLLQEQPEYVFLKLQPFTTTDQLNYFGEKNYLTAHEVGRFEPELVRIPMLANMIKLLISEGKTKNIRCRSDVYQEFIEYIFSKHSSNKPLKHDLKNKALFAIEKLSYVALAAKKPRIQSIEQKFYYQKNISDLPIDDLPKIGLVNLLFERGEEVVQFTHLSFQEFLAALYLHHHVELIDIVLNEMWASKWREVLKHLTGLRGKEIIAKILASKDNVLHTKVFLAAECYGELKDEDKEIKKQLTQKITEMVSQKPFREQAIASLSHLKDINQLKLLVESKEEEVRDAALTAIGKLGELLDEKYIIRIIGILKKAKFGCYAAVDALSKLGSKMGKRAFNELVLLLNSKNEEVRLDALEVIHNNLHLVTSSTIKIIANLLKNRNLQYPDFPLSVLVDLQDKLSDAEFNIIVDCLKSNYSGVQDASINALTDMKDNISDKVMEKIMNLLNHRDGAVRGAVIGLLENIRTRVDDRAMEKIAELYNKRSRRAVAIGAYAAVGKLPADKTVNDFLKHLNDDDPDIVIDTINLLIENSEKITDSFHLNLVKMLEETGNYDSWEIFSCADHFKNQISDEEVSELVTLLSHDDYLVVEDALWVLGALNERVSEAGLKQIISLVKDNNEYIRKAAIKTLGYFSNRLGKSGVRKLLNIAKNQQLDTYECETAINTLIKFVMWIDDSTINQLIALLQKSQFEMEEAIENLLFDLRDILKEKHIRKLFRMCKKDNGKYRYDVLLFLLEVPDKLNELKLADVFELVDQINVDVKIGGLTLLENMDTKLSQEQIGKILKLLRSQVRGVYWGAQNVLEGITDQMTESQIQEVKRMLKSKRPTTRAAAINVLGMCKNKLLESDIEEISNYLNDNEYQVYEAAKTVLTSMYESGVAIH